MPSAPVVELVPAVEVCSRLRVDRSTLTRWVQAGKAEAAYKLPGLRGAYLFTPDEVARLEVERS